MINSLTSILIGSILLSSIHVLIPVHWLPIITMSSKEKWTNPQTMFATFVIAVFHILSTVLIGIGVGFLGYKLSVFYKSYAAIIAALILVIIGLVYLFSEVIHKLGHKYFHLGHHHHHGEHDILASYDPHSQKKYNALLISLAASSFLTPCVELEAYYFSAGLHGWYGILLVSAIYIVITVFLTSLLVYFSLIGRNKLKFEFLNKYESQILRIIMVLIGISLYILE